MRMTGPAGDILPFGDTRPAPRWHEPPGTGRAGTLDRTALATPLSEALPPDWAWAERLGCYEHADEGRPLADPAPDWPAAVLMPLVARARGAVWFPHFATSDPMAVHALSLLGTAAAQAHLHRGSVFAALSRQRWMRRRAADFLRHRPGATRMVIGAGFSRLDAVLGVGPRWIDVDGAAVCAWRRRHWGGPAVTRRLDVAADLDDPSAWAPLLRAHAAAGRPMLVLCEGLAGRLERAALQSLLRALGTFAPPGTRVLLDVASHPAAGREAGPGTTLGHRRGAGLRAVDELIAPHPRLYLHGSFAVLSPRGPWYAAWDLMARVLTGVPWYAVYELGVDA